MPASSGASLNPWKRTSGSPGPSPVRCRAPRGLFRRNYVGHRVLHRLFGLQTIPEVPHLLRASAGAVAGDLATLAREGAAASAWLAAPAQALAASYGQYRGARDEAEGRPYPEWA